MDESRQQEFMGLIKSQNANGIRRFLYEELAFCMGEMADKLFERDLIREAITYNAILGKAYNITETAYRSGIFRTIIEERGLKDNEDDIIYGLNKACRKVNFDSRPKTIEDSFVKTRAESLCLIQLGREYIDKWQMYNNLFRE